MIENYKRYLLLCLRVNHSHPMESTATVNRVLKAKHNQILSRIDFNKPVSLNNIHFVDSGDYIPDPDAYTGKIFLTDVSTGKLTICETLYHANQFTGANILTILKFAVNKKLLRGKYRVNVESFSNPDGLIPLY